MTLSPATLKRLQDRERDQRRQTKKQDLPCEPVSVEGLWLIQRGLCGCPERCGPINPDAVHGDDDHIIIGHIHARRFKGWHTVDNVRLQRADCNRKASGEENTAAGKGRRFAPDCVTIIEKREKKDKPKTNWPKGRTLPTNKDRERVRNR